MDKRVRATLLGAVLVVGCSRQEREAAILGAAAAPTAPITERRSTDCWAPIGLDVVPVSDGRSGSTVVLARVHGRLLAYVADEDASAVRVLDVETPAELGSVAMPGRPARMLMLQGGRLAVTVRDAARVALYTPSPIGDAGLDPLCSLDTPDEPVDLAATANGKSLLVLSDWGHALTAFDLGTGARRFAVDLPRAPRAVVASSDGIHAYVAHAAGGSMSAIDLQLPAPVAQAIDLRGESRDPFAFITKASFFCALGGNRGRQALFPRSTTRPRTACQGFALAETSGPSPHIFAPMVEVATGDLEEPSSGYGPGASATPELPVVAILDASSGTPIQGSLVAHEPKGAIPPPCLLPRAAAATKGLLYVACMGIDSVIEYDTFAGGSGTHERRRWPVPSGPSGIALHGSRAVVWSQFGRETTILSLADDAQPLRLPVDRLPPTGDQEAIALGRTLFHASSDPRISSDGRACASCHPNGRDDGLVWSTPGGGRQTPMLAGRLPFTAPYGWDGAGRDVAHHLDHTFARLEGRGLPPRERGALERYILTLEGPTVHVGTEEGEHARGREVFLSAGCGSCHSPESAWTDGHRHEVGSHAPGDTVASFDTPSLRFVGGTAPYFHDGRYSTLRALLASSSGPMGAARNGPPEDLEALEAFVRSL
jgi:mono/diheme cytochrome c family protein